jgi:hypothetical protein
MLKGQLQYIAFTKGRLKKWDHLQLHIPDLTCDNTVLQNQSYTHYTQQHICPQLHFNHCSPFTTIKLLQAPSSLFCVSLSLSLELSPMKYQHEFKDSKNIKIIATRYHSKIVATTG